MYIVSYVCKVECACIVTFALSLSLSNTHINTTPSSHPFTCFPLSALPDGRTGLTWCPGGANWYILLAIHLCCSLRWRVVCPDGMCWQVLFVHVCVWKLCMCCRACLTCVYMNVVLVLCMFVVCMYEFCAFFLVHTWMFRVCCSCSLWMYECSRFVSLWKFVVYI